MGHRTTDPACRFHKVPKWWLARVLYDRARGRSCLQCMRSREV